VKFEYLNFNIHMRYGSSNEFFEIYFSNNMNRCIYFKICNKTIKQLCILELLFLENFLSSFYSMMCFNF
jgi:hypothetical protein